MQVGIFFRDNKTFPQWPVNQNSIFDKFAAWIDNFVFNSDYRITTDKVLIVALISNVLGFHRVYSGRKISTILGWILLLFSFFSRDIALFLLLPWLIVDFIRISLGNYGRLKTNQKADFRKVKDHFLNKTLTKNTAIILSVSLLSLLYVLLFSPKTDTSKSNVTVSQTDIVVSNSDNNDDAIDVASVFSVTEITEILERGIARLTDNQRQVYRMNFFDDLPVSTISKTLNLNYKSVEHRLGSARKEVRKYVERMLA